MKALKVIGFIVLFIIIAAAAGGAYVNFVLPKTDPASTEKIAATPERLARGKYLAINVSACMDCHSDRDVTLFAGPAIDSTLGKGGALFDEQMGLPGKIYASNITPYALGNWTDGEILRAITTGVSKNGRALFPFMAYNRFGKMDKEDIFSIIVYMRSLKAVDNKVPPTCLNFPVNLLVNTLPEKAAFQKIPDERDIVRYGGYLVNAAGCVDCHSKTDHNGIIAGTEFGGGMEFKQPNGVMISPNITGNKKNGIGNWTKEAFVQRFKMYADSSYKPHKIDKNEIATPMPWIMYAGMHKKDLEAIYVYLRSVKEI